VVNCYNEGSAELCNIFYVTTKQNLGPSMQYARSSMADFEVL
jgi:hypothetical protein